MISRSLRSKREKATPSIDFEPIKAYKTYKAEFFRLDFFQKTVSIVKIVLIIFQAYDILKLYLAEEKL